METHKPLSGLLRVINPDHEEIHPRPVLPNITEPQPLSRKVSKTLVESPSIDYLPPLQSLPPLDDIFDPSPPSSDLHEHELERTSSIAPSIAPSTAPSIAPSIAPSAAHSINSYTPSQAFSFQSKYSKASYSLTNHPDALKLYRSMAMKTKDPIVQLTYAKYLLEIAHLYPQRPLTRIDTRRSIEPTEDDTKQKRLQEEGVRWIKRLAGQGVGEAAYILGSWLENGTYGFKKSLGKALRYYEVAAKERVPRAMFAVAQYHEREQDYMTSFQLYEDAASMGLSNALYRIAMIHLKGEFGSRQNPKAAIQLLVKACEKSADDACPEAPYTLGLLLINDCPSINIPNDLIQIYGGTSEGIHYIEYAADVGFSDAQFKLAEIHEQGKHNLVNIARAYQYYEMAAKSNPWAMLALSRILNQGVQVPPEQAEEQRFLFEHDESQWVKTHTRNEDGAFRWCMLAADRGIADAYYLLGWYYEMGIGILRDYKQALHFYLKAAKANHSLAKERALLLESTAKKIQNKSKGSMQCLVM